MSVTPTLRPPRTTPRLQLPVPGDANPADYVTDTGAICDRLDQILTPSPVVTALPSNPADGDEIYYQVNADAIWHLRRSSTRGGWHFLGGPSLAASDPGAATIAANTMTIVAPILSIPLAGMYEFAFTAAFNEGAGYAQATIWPIADANPDPTMWAYAPVNGTPPATASRTLMQRTVAAGNVRMCVWMQQGGTALGGRSLAAQPVVITG